MLRFGALKRGPKSTWASGIYLAMELHKCCKDNVSNNGMMDGFKKKFGEKGFQPTNIFFLPINKKHKQKNNNNCMFFFSFLYFCLYLNFMCFRKNYNDEQQTKIKHNKKPNNKKIQRNNKQTQADMKTT